MKYLVLGCNGMAGHLISLYLYEQGYEVLGFARAKSKLVPSIDGDAEDFSSIKKVIDRETFDVVVNCIGVLNQAAEDQKVRAVMLNSLLPHYLAKITKNSETKIIHMSTDCVFSGRRGAYTEKDCPDGETFYDKTKALGELNDSKNLTLRNSIVGPDIKKEGIGLFNWFMQQQGSIQGYSKVLWTGLTTLQLAKVIEKAAKRRVTGLYNMVPTTDISKYDLLRLFNHYFREDKLAIYPNDKFVLNKSLTRTRYDFDVVIPDYEIMVKELKGWVSGHRSLYPHYTL